MLVEPTDNFVGLDEDSDSDSLEGIVIESGDCVHFNANIPIVRELA